MGDSCGSTPPTPLELGFEVGVWHPVRALLGAELDEGKLWWHLRLLASLGLWSRAPSYLLCLWILKFFLIGFRSRRLA